MVGAISTDPRELEAYADDGVDVTLIVEMLERTPEERLAALEAFVAGLRELQDAVGKPAV